jgi:hypothetical protein
MKGLPFKGLDSIDIRNQLLHPFQKLLHRDIFLELYNHQMLEVPHGLC